MIVIIKIYTSKDNYVEKRKYVKNDLLWRKVLKLKFLPRGFYVGFPLYLISSSEPCICNLSTTSSNYS